LSQCQGRGKKKSVSKKLLHRYQIALDEKKRKPKALLVQFGLGHLYSCLNCFGSGLVPSVSPPIADKENYPHVAIIGGGIEDSSSCGLFAPQYPFTLFERDKNFDARSPATD
jgi:hypothetical protein